MLSNISIVESIQLSDINILKDVIYSLVEHHNIQNRNIVSYCKQANALVIQVQNERITLGYIDDALNLTEILFND